jgi:ribosome-binding factor A
MSAERMRQVNEEIRTRVAEIVVRDLELPLGSFVTVNSVDTSKDLKHARVYITILPDNLRGSTMDFIKRKTGYVQKLLGSRISMKFTPRLRFILDDGLIKAQEVFDVMDRG